MVQNHSSENLAIYFCILILQIEGLVVDWNLLEYLMLDLIGLFHYCISMLHLDSSVPGRMRVQIR